MELKQGTRVRFTANALGAIAKDGAYGSRMVGGLVYGADELGTIEARLPELERPSDSAEWYAITPDRQPEGELAESGVYVPAHVSMFEVVV